MIASLIIVFREVIEAGLIVGIVLAITSGVPRRGRWVMAGIVVGVAGATLVAVFAGALSNALAGVGQEIFNASILALAVVMLAWHNIWMARHGRELAAQMKEVGRAVAAGSRPLAALAIVVGVAVLREGSEIVLFLYGLTISGGTSTLELLAGGMVGLLLGCAVSALTFFGLVNIPARYLFGITTTLITFLAAGLAAQSILFLQQAGIITALAQTVWDTSNFLTDSSLVGRVLHTLIGYTDQPSGMQVVAYVITLLIIFSLTKFLAPTKSGAESQREDKLFGPM
jgi:high-affinity iron transporter